MFNVDLDENLIVLFNKRNLHCLSKSLGLLSFFSLSGGDRIDRVLPLWRKYSRMRDVCMDIGRNSHTTIGNSSWKSFWGNKSNSCVFKMKEWVYYWSKQNLLSSETNPESCGFLEWFTTWSGIKTNKIFARNIFIITVGSAFPHVICQWGRDNVKQSWMTTDTFSSKYIAKYYFSFD